MYTPKYYHIYNRGLDKRIIFPEESFYQRFMVNAFLSRLKNAPKASVYYKQLQLNILPNNIEKSWGPSLVDIVCYCLMPNHYHFLLKENEEFGVAKFMQRIGIAFTRYFDLKNKREGRLFTSKYKFVVIDNDEQLVHVARYIHLNPNESSYTNVSILDLPYYQWSSLETTLKGQTTLYCQPEELLNFYKSPKDYWDFVSQGSCESLNIYSPQNFIDIDIE